VKVRSEVVVVENFVPSMVGQARGRVPVVGTETREDVAETALVEMVLVAGEDLDIKVETVDSEKPLLLH
jgi:hypothetical protein